MVRPVHVLAARPLNKFVGMIRRHQSLILHCFTAKKAYSSGVVEGLSRKVNLVVGKAFGFRRYDVPEIALFHTMGGIGSQNHPTYFSEEAKKKRPLGRF